MPLGARRRLHVFTLTPLGHQGLTPWIRFGNRQLGTQAETEAQVVNDEFVDDVANLEPIDEEE